MKNQSAAKSRKKPYFAPNEFARNGILVSPWLCTYCSPFSWWPWLHRHLQVLSSPSWLQPAGSESSDPARSPATPPSRCSWHWSATWARTDRRRPRRRRPRHRRGSAGGRLRPRHWQEQGQWHLSASLLGLGVSPTWCPRYPCWRTSRPPPWPGSRCRRPFAANKWKSET